MTMKIGGTELHIERKNKVYSALRLAIGPALALLLAFLCTAIIILLSGKNPLLAFREMFYGAFGSMVSLTETLVKSVPLLLAGLGLAKAATLKDAQPKNEVPLKQRELRFLWLSGLFFIGQLGLAAQQEHQQKLPAQQQKNRKGRRV